MTVTDAEGLYDAAFRAYRQANAEVEIARIRYLNAPLLRKPAAWWRLDQARMNQHGCYVTLVELREHLKREVEP